MPDEPDDETKVRMYVRRLFRRRQPEVDPPYGLLTINLGKVIDGLDIREGDYLARYEPERVKRAARILLFHTTPLTVRRRQAGIALGGLSEDAVRHRVVRELENVLTRQLYNKLKEAG